MNTKLITRLLPCVLLAGTVFAAPGEEKKEITIRRIEKGSGAAPHAKFGVLAKHSLGETEKVAFLGVETSPVGRTLAAQLGLPRDTGLVVTGIAKDSPAATVLQEHDILTKFEDQILIDSHQLSVLVRGKKEGDEVKLTVYRAGKETKVAAKLAQHEVAVAQTFAFPQMLPGFNLGALAAPAAGGKMTVPGLEPDEVGNVVRMIGREHGNWFAAPRVHVFRHATGKDASTILDMTKGNFVFSDDTGSVELNAGDDKRELTVKNEKGDVIFSGPITTEEDRKKIPAEVQARLKKIETFDLEVEPGVDFEQGAAAIGSPHKVRFVPAAPAGEPRRSL